MGSRQWARCWLQSTRQIGQRRKIKDVGGAAADTPCYPPSETSSLSQSSLSRCMSTMLAPRCHTCKPQKPPGRSWAAASQHPNPLLTAGLCSWAHAPPSHQLGLPHCRAQAQLPPSKLSEDWSSAQEVPGEPCRTSGA